MKTVTKSLSIISLLFMTGCVGESLNPLVSNLDQTDTQQALIFKTNEHSFMNDLKSVSNKEQRNEFMDEFLLKSDMQCANYLNAPLKKSATKEKQNDSLYMSIFDTASSLFGIRYVTDTAKAVFLSDENGENKEEKATYENALSPEIRKGVEIGRVRYAKKMEKKKPLPLKEYSISNLKRDMLTYDKQCDTTYGLIEISRALKAMQTQVNTRTVIKKEPVLSINPETIKKRVTEATKEVVEKKEDKERKKNQENNTTQISSENKILSL